MKLCKNQNSEMEILTEKLTKNEKFLWRTLFIEINFKIHNSNLVYETNTKENQVEYQFYLLKKYNENVNT